MTAFLSSIFARSAVLVAFVASLLLCGICMAGQPAAEAKAAGHGCCSRTSVPAEPAKQHGSPCDHCERMLLGVVGVVTKVTTADDAAAPIDLCPIDPVRDVPSLVATRIDPMPVSLQWPPTLLRLRCAMNL